MLKKGFTLVELMVVIGIMSIITLVISQPLANVIKYQRESQINDNMRDNLQFVMNKMEKELKTSKNVTIAAGILKFINQDGTPKGYYLDGDEIKLNIYDTKDVLITGDINITENTVFTVDALNFNITNPPAGSTLTKGLVTVQIDASALNTTDKVSMQISVYPVNN
ncbi:MAG: PulJ/GspJ family protein [Minisyncoccia bacterium]